MLQKDTSDVKLVETQGPRNENTGSEGFGALAQAAKVFGDARKNDDKAKALAKQGELVNDFLAQRVEASLETEGFRDLSDEAKNDITLGLGEFDRHLDQVSRSKGNQYTKAEILRTQKAMEEIAKNPANHESIIKAAGLSDKIAGPLRDSLKEEEEHREGVMKDMAEAQYKEAQENGVYVPPHIAANPRDMLWFTESNPEMGVIRATKVLQAQARLDGAKRDATEVQRNIAMNGEIPALSQGLLQFALDAGQGNKNTGQSLLALDQKFETDLLNFEAQYPYASADERNNYRRKLQTVKDTAAAYIKGEHKAAHIDLYMRNLNIISKKEQIKSAKRANYVGDLFDLRKATVKQQIDENALLLNGVAISAAITKQLDTTDPFTQNLLADNPQLRRGYEQAAMYAMHGNVEDFNEIALESGSPYVQADVAFNSLMSNVENPERIDDMDPERLVNMIENMEVGLQQTREQSPERYRAFMDKFLKTIPQSEKLQDVMRDNPRLMAPLAEMAAGEVRQDLQGTILELGKDSLSIFDGSAVFNKKGTGNLFTAFSETVLTGLNTVGNAAVEAIAGDTPAGIAARNAKEAQFEELSRAFKALADNPDQRAFYNNIGAFMEIDEDAVRQGEMKFKLSEDAGKFIQDPNFKQAMTQQIRQHNARHSAGMTEKLKSYNLIQGYENPFYGYEEIMFGQGNLDLTNFIPSNTAIGADLPQGTN